MEALLCDEELFLSTPSPSFDPRGYTIFRPDDSNSLYLFDGESEEELKIVMRNYMNRESVYTPINGYLDNLRNSSHLCAARFRAVRWIIMVGSRLGLQYGTIFAAVNYLDRFMSLNYHIKKWEVWMIELIPIACLSIASKVDEVFIPSLHDFQTEDLEHMYRPSTIERMELAILRALDWRLVSITPYSFIDLLIQRIGSHHASLRTHTIELLLKALLEAKFVNCSASAIAVSALKCSIEELTPFESDACISIILEDLMPPKHKEENSRCYMLMEEQIADPHCCPMSPITVIPTDRRVLLDSYIDIDTCFIRSKNYSSPDFNPKK